MTEIVSDNPFETTINLLTTKIGNHPLFSELQSLEDLQIFSQHHVFAVWDFMCLLKTLQRKITCVTVPWFPPQDNLGSHLVNSILVEEESDLLEEGRYLSHFELYVEAMEEAGAETYAIQRFLNTMRNGGSFSTAIEADYIPVPAKEFVKTTFSILDQHLHQLAAAFVYGRENITNMMFAPLVENLAKKGVSSIQKFEYYFRRHMKVDTEEHAPKAKKLLANLCGNSLHKWDEARKTALQALQARHDLLEGIYLAIKSAKKMS